ncbi:alpha-hydroxy-acid oxidizing protein [Leucobacter sp. CSA1]|uniref:Alpha-hydroxy-acid oxidizing protein n=1 Tax=Leucobacter chromiisoli TaxID=2796471 RepID=A0A934Q8R8_9MICO|nr:alpha-hydroxy acid oxidase [Leucobacter chromiisoli]MBK0419563.1 alpha-hydroxy-acid oxidizing protein [Leucobacter chromiisoli]
MKKPYSIEHLRLIARRRLPAMVFDFLDGGVLDELALRRNRQVLEAILMDERVLFDASRPALGARVLDTDFAIPMTVSPMGMLTGFHPSSDPAVARAAAAAGSIFIHSAWSSCAMEEVAESAPGRVWTQMSFWKDERESRQLEDRAAALGLDTLVVAGDVAVSQRRERDIRHGTAMPPKPPLRDVVNTALHPGWMARWLTGRPITFGNYRIDGRRLRMRDMDPWMMKNENPAASWEHFTALRKTWKGKLIVKGVMSPVDAKMAVDLGADGVFVSNHGGRQFDAVPATVEVLPRIAEAVGGRAAVMVDGGVRRGSDIAKMLAQGADLVSGGRPFAFALAAGGEAGVRSAFEIFKDELETTLGFVGAQSVADLGPEALVHVPPFGAPLR